MGVAKQRIAKGNIIKWFCADDNLICPKRKHDGYDSYITDKCTQFSLSTKRLNLTIELKEEPGVQLLHDVGKPWIACTIFCAKNNTNFFYYLLRDVLTVDIIDLEKTVKKLSMQKNWDHKIRANINFIFDNEWLENYVENIFIMVLAK